MKTSAHPPRPVATQAQTSAPALTAANLVRRHLCFGWWVLLIFLTAGLTLEALHGFKVEGYLRVSNETRRLMWTLAHAHGTLLGLVNLAFAAAVGALPGWLEPNRRLASTSLLAATVLMPAGFFLGGLFIYGGDPGLGILLLPVGGVLLFVAVLLTALATRHYRPDQHDAWDLSRRDGRE